MKKNKGIITKVLRSLLFLTIVGIAMFLGPYFLVNFERPQILFFFAACLALEKIYYAIDDKITLLNK